jgi:hypothetical protein
MNGQNHEESKKQSEQVWARILAGELNKEKGSDYTVYPELSENSPVDVFLISPSKQFPILNLQLTHAVEVPFIVKDEKLPPDYTNFPTAEAIERKKNKLLNQGAELQEIVLVIQGYMEYDAALASFADKSFARYHQFPFKGIYYVSPTMVNGETGSEAQHGYIIKIKDPFNKN